jgi:hypothetical protein
MKKSFGKEEVTDIDKKSRKSKDEKGWRRNGRNPE